MNICIISQHIIMQRQNFTVTNPQHIDQVKLKSEMEASAPKTHPLDPPLLSFALLVYVGLAMKK